MSDIRVTDKDYLFLSAMLKAREPNMLTRERVERLLSSASFAEAAKLLTDIGYEDMSSLDARGVDEALAKQRKNIFDEIVRLVPEPGVVDVFRMKYDYHNAKVLVKAEGAGVEGGTILSEAGRNSPRVIEEAFREEDFRFIPPALGKALQEAKSVLARTGNPQLADFAVDRAYFAEMLEITKGLSSPFMRGYALLLIDSANLRIAVRMVRMGRSQEFLRSALIPGGSIGEERIAQSVSSGDGLAGLFSATPLKEAAVLGAEAIKGGTMTRFELSCDNAVMSFLSGAKMVGFGAETVVGYLAAVESGITAVRMILTGLMAGIDPEQLKGRLRNTYA